MSQPMSDPTRLVCWSGRWTKLASAIALMISGDRSGNAWRSGTTTDSRAGKNSILVDTPLVNLDAEGCALQR